MPPPPTPPPSAWRACLVALRVGAVLLVAGWALGGGLALISPWLGMVVPAVFMLLFGAGWATGQVGGPGLAAALVGLVAGLGAAREAHRASVVTTVELAPLASMTQWEPQRSPAARVEAPVQAIDTLRVSLSRKVASGKNSSTTWHAEALPLVEAGAGPIVGFTCRDPQEPDPSATQGTVLLAPELFLARAPPLCASAIAEAVQKAQRAGRTVEPHAADRVALVFRDEASLRAHHRLDLAVAIPLVGFLLYAVGVIVFRRRLAVR